MEKQIISKDEERLNIVILKNEEYGIVVKGIARCHADDEYDKEKGIQLANTRAWIKYYKKLGKDISDNIDLSLRVLKYWEDRSVKLQQEQHNADSKLKELEVEYTKMIGTI